MATQQPVFSAFSATKFNLTGATGSWSEFAHRSADYGIEDYVYDVPCVAVPCLQKCQTKWVAPYVPYSRRKGAEMDACVEECKGDSDPMDECLATNATAIIETATETAVSETTLSETTLSETATDVQASETLSTADAEATDVPDNLGYSFRAEDNSLGILLGCVAIAVGLMV
ncbi:hypothetical protein AK830_g10098 [Neonectria ditissima]|uniref:Uncharacterized protein n=1 Tax=Neonectria ditissima TaxID=78410 RepID=A0A0N8H5L2_9HYPO|nr:hypothetical protein AK830_g10098 [Neonectria ditissima]